MFQIHKGKVRIFQEVYRALQQYLISPECHGGELLAYDGETSMKSSYEAILHCP